MNAPNKIYLNAPKIQPELDNTTWDTKAWKDCENIEYIRKDALLEWLNKTAAEYKKRSDEGELVWQNWCAYIDVIKHLNEM